MLDTFPMKPDEPTLTKVIVADDHSEMRALVALSLRDAGYDVVEVSDGAVLWRQLLDAPLDDDNPCEAELVVSDIRMPGATGIDVLNRLRQAKLTTPVILMTAFGDQATHDEARRLGAARIFDKPFEMRELVSAALCIVAPRPTR